MSSQSFDESSNLVIKVTSPTEPESTGAESSEPGETEKSNFKEKHKGGLHFIKKRAKSPFRSPLKSPIKSPFKSPKTSSKTSNSDQELLTEDFKDIEKKISEKKSEEWQVFQQMQDRIKLNMLKTKSSLTKLNSESSEDHADDMEGKKISDRDQNTLILDESLKANKEICDNDELLNLELQQLSVTPVPCPRGIPKPPANSLRTSMENLSNLQAENISGNIEGDLLGLSDDLDNGNKEIQSTNTYINPDLLELDGFMSSTDSQYGSSMHSSFDEGDMTYGSSMHSARSSARTTPLGFDQGSWIETSTQSSSMTSKFVSDLVDEFLQLDTMKEAAASVETKPSYSSSKSADLLDSLDPFSSNTATPNTSQTHAINVNSTFLDTSTSSTQQKQSDQISSLDPFGFDNTENLSTKREQQENVLETGSPMGADAAPIFDPFNGCKDNTIGRSISPHVYDNFGFGLTNASDENNEDNVDHTNSELDSESNKECGKFDNLNPFLTDENSLRTDVFEEKFLELANKSNLSNVDLAWGSQNDNVIEKHSINPFKDDIFASDSAIEIVNQPKLGKNNPFLDDTCEVVIGADITSNPFLDLDSAPPQTQDMTDFGLSDVSDFLMGNDSKKTEPIKSGVDDFDPFKTIQESHEDFITYEKAAGFSTQSELQDNQINQAEITERKDDKEEDEDEDQDDDIFKLKIKPIAADPNKPKPPTDLGAMPLLKPPPKIPKSPQPPRVNPFDRDSPPEEDFAKFEIMHEKEEAESSMPEQSVSFSTTISTTESVTPEEEQNLEPLEPFYPEEEKDGWKLMLRQPTKKKLTTNRFWKGVIVRLVKTEEGPVIKVFSEKRSDECYHELPLQPCYSVSDVSQQHYDQYGKIHTLKIQYIFYRERVGIKTDRITPSFVKKPKATMILDHAPQVSEMMKLGSLDRNEIKSFGRAIENALMNLDAHREKTLTYVKEEVCAEVVDEYEAELDKAGVLLKQKARVRVFFLAFVTGMPMCEIGLNDRRRDGKEVVGRHDIIPIKTEEWIKLEDVEFHCCVDKDEFEKTNNIKFHPLDACHFEVLRYRVRLRQNKELPLQLRIQQTLKEQKCEIRCDLLVTGYHSFSKKHGQFPCENIEVHFPIPEQWIYLFRYEKRFRYGSFKSSTRKPGKIKGLERLTMIAQGLLTPTLMEADVGSAKYEHLNRAVVWRIPRLPEKNEGAYTSHLFKLTLEFGAHDEMPDSFEQFTTVDFTMPSCTVSKSQVRSISVENPTPPEKWVKYLAKYHYKIEIDHRDERVPSSKESPASDSE
ncbi:uncharacterized protein LOC133181930 [Saccostrea echinata]|uniref:uncharacterized protein LOC133181930 n=1 Tax=Saccostrea echinata TaxID=191078 RepID=UPI002A83A075|nr:uncharacterized protein LOC133181930 [Saccostrea echinata]